MRNLIAANLRTHFKFYARNYVLWGAAAALLVMALVPVLSFAKLSSAGRFDALRIAFSSMSFFSAILAAGLCLFLMSSHLKSRNVKMVLTKPCPPEIWLFSVFLSAALVSLVVNVAMCAGVGLLSWVWGLPFQGGFVFESVRTLFVSIVYLSLVGMLAVVLHPTWVLAIAYLLNDFVFGGLGGMLKGVVLVEGAGPVRRFMAHSLDVLYYLTPVSNPFGERLKDMAASMRVPDGGWIYLLYTAAYAAVISSLCFCLAVLFLRRKRLA